MQYEDTIEIRGVTVVRETDVALLCRMGNQHRWITPTELQPGSTVACLGDSGIVVLSSGRSLSSRAWSLSKGRMTLDVLMAGDTGLKALVNQQVAVPPFPVHF